AAAARIATESLRSRAQWPVVDLIQYCHSVLQKSRGVVLSLASIDADKNQMNWVGIGNVEGALFRADPAAQRLRELLPYRGGVLGYQLPPLRVQTLSIASGDTVIFVTDGIESGCLVASPTSWDPQALADYIVSRHGKQTDDALALVVRYNGSQS